KKKESEKDKKFLGWFRNRVRKEKEFLVREEDEEDTEESDAEGEKEKGDEKKDEAREQQHIVESEKPKNSKTPREKE
ncbi:MAG: hypothetical protein RLZZ115_1133, partial [Cyanobacteriota bacterium]